MKNLFPWKTTDPNEKNFTLIALYKIIKYENKKVIYQQEKITK